MTRKTKSLYQKVFEAVRSAFPAFSPSTGMGDYENASADAAVSCFLNMQYGRCQFHYSQCIWRKIQNLSLSKLYKENESFRSYAKKIMSLPYLPPESIEPTALLVMQSALNIPENCREKIEKLNRYITQFWLRKVGPDKISVFHFERSTNNNVESFHSRIKAIIKTHRPSFWNFVQHINHIILDTAKDMERAERGLPISRKQKAKFRKNIERRELCKEKLRSGDYTPIQFLSSVSHTIDPSTIVVENSERLGMEANEEEEQEEQQPEQQHEEQHPPHQACCICLGSRENAKVFIPCGHGGCGRCVDTIMGNEVEVRCPLCRTAATGAMAVYF